MSRSSVELTARPDVAEGGELADRARQLGRPRLQLAQEPRVLDGDDGLVGEGLDQLDLGVGERAGRRRPSESTPIGRPPRRIGTESWLRKPSPLFRLARRGGSSRVLEVRHVDDSCLDDGPTGEARRVRGSRVDLAYHRPGFGGTRRELDRNEPSVLDREDASKIGGAEAHRAVHDRGEHGLDVGLDRLMTRSTSAVAVCRASASVSSRLRASSSVNSRTFSMAITAWSAKVWSSAICLSENVPCLGTADRDGARSRHPFLEHRDDQEAPPAP